MFPIMMILFTPTNTVLKVRRRCRCLAVSDCVISLLQLEQRRPSRVWHMFTWEIPSVETILACLLLIYAKGRPRLSLVLLITFCYWSPALFQNENCCKCCATSPSRLNLYEGWSVPLSTCAASCPRYQDFIITSIMQALLIVLTRPPHLPPLCVHHIPRS